MIGYGQQLGQDYSPDDNYNDQMMRLKAQRIAQEQSVPSVGHQYDLSKLSEGVKEQQSSEFIPAEKFDSGAAAQGFSRGASGGLGSGVMGAGIATMNPYLIAGGLAIGAVEGSAKAKQMQSEADAQAAQQRKKNQMDSINQMIAVSKGLTLGA